MNNAPQSDVSDSPLFRAAVERHRAGDLDGAEAAYRQVLSAEPTHTGALHLLGVVNGQRGDHWTALDLIQRSLQYDPHSAEAHYNLGFNLENLGDFDQASACYQRAIDFNPHYVEAILSLGNVLTELGRASDAIEQYHRVLALKPGYASAYNNLGIALLSQRRVGDAAKAYRRAIELKPDHSDAHSNLLLALNYDPHVSAEQLFAEHRSWADAHAPQPDGVVQIFSNRRNPERRLRVGYVSGDLWRHAVSSFFETLVDQHDRHDFEVFCYSNSLRSDEVTQRLKEKSDHWISIAGHSDAVAAARIRHDGIDILVDLSGHTAHNRLKLFRLKPAPLQVTWLGYPNTTGLKAMDYRITDQLADPKGDADLFYTERLVPLERCFLCYWPPDDAPPVGPLPARSDNHVTFGSFNTLTKVTQDVVRVWSRILMAVPGSKLYLKARQLRDKETLEQIVSQFAAEGIRRSSLELAPAMVAKADHLDAYGRVDIALDPFPYNGTTTTCEALWMGVPVVTLRDTRHAGRVGTSLLAAVGLNELIATDENEYVERAATLAASRDRLEELRVGLRERMRRSELCDAAGFARSMEGAYRRMWQARCAVEPCATDAPSW